MTYDVDALRAEFPSLASGIAHFDSPGGTQTPRAVGEAIAATVTGPLSNRGSLVDSEHNAERAVSDFRRAFSDLLGYPAQGIIYGRSATQLILELARTLSQTWQPGDEVALTRLDHDANVRPWLIAAERAGVSVNWLDLDPTTGELAEPSFSARTRLVALPGASNLIGTIPPLRRLIEAAHEVGALVHVDGVHYAAHHFVDDLGADFFTCSPYKFLGPHCAVQAADPQLLEHLHPDKLLPSTQTVPERFELGTLPYELMAGATAAVDVIAGLGSGPTRRDALAAAWAAIDSHEQRLRSRVEQVVRTLPGVRLHSLAAQRTPTLLLTFDHLDAHEVAHQLAERRIHAPAGIFYAYEPARRLGIEAGLRIGMAPYTSEDEVDRLIEALTTITTGRSSA